MNKLQEAIYEKCKDIITKGFEPNEIEEILSGYKDYLIEKYNDTYNDKPIETCISAFTKLEILIWSNKSVEEKKVLLIKDEYLEKIGKISNIAFKNASAKKCNNLSAIDITKEKADQYIAEMESYIDKIKPHNRGTAEMYLSEGTLDFQYSLGLIEYTSLRIGRLR